MSIRTWKQIIWGSCFRDTAQVVWGIMAQDLESTNVNVYRSRRTLSPTESGKEWGEAPSQPVEPPPVLLILEYKL